MEDQEINFEVVEEVVIARLVALGLRPEQIEGCIDTGYPHFHIARGECQMAHMPKTGEYLAAVELNANIKKPEIGDFVISDLTVARESSPEAALETATRNYLNVTFPAIRALFDEKVAEEIQKTSSIGNIKSFTAGANQFVEWRVFTGELQILNDSGGGLTEYASNTPPFLLIFDTVTGYFSEPQIHWCKLYISKQGADLIVGCSIDGSVSEEAEAEIRAKFTYDGQPGYELRQFFIFQPLRFIAEDDRAREELLKYHEEMRSKPKKSWWQFWKQGH